MIGLDASQIGDLAFENGIRVHELTTKEATLEEAFLEITGGAQEFQASAPPPHRPPPGQPGPPPGPPGPPPGQWPGSAPGGQA